jgi:hypothetical protein
MAGASLSVLLLISIYNRPMLQVLQTEQFAGEVIRTLVGSIGLVLAVPLTTAVGVAVVRASGRHGPVPERGARPARQGRSSRADEAATAGAAMGTTAEPGAGEEREASPDAATAGQARSETGRGRRAADTGRRRRSRDEDDDLDFTDLHD